MAKSEEAKNKSASNLIKFKKGDPRTIELARKGGNASAEKREELKTAREYVGRVLSGTIKDKDGNTIYIKDALIRKLVNSAVQEVDLNKIKYILDLIGEGATDKLDVTTNGNEIGDSHAALIAAFNKHVKK